jgi:hypothetical protein
MIPANRLTPTVSTDQPESATTIRTCTVKQRDFFAPVGEKNVTFRPLLLQYDSAMTSSAIP